MKVIVERDLFAEAVGAVKHATDKALKIPILANALLRANGVTLEVAATNLDCRSEFNLPAQIQRDGDDLNEITVPVSLLSDLASRMPKGAHLSVEWNKTSHHVTLSAGRSRYKLHALPASDFPVLPSPEGGVTFSMPGKLLAHALNTVRWTAYDGIDRPQVSGVFLHITDNDHPALGQSKAKRLAFVATNHAQLARFTVDVPEGLTSLPHLILPNASIPEIARLANEATDEVEISASETKLRVSDGTAVFLTKIIDGRFPENYASMAIPKQEDARMVVDADLLRDALLRLKALGQDNRTRAAFADGALTLTLVNAERGQAEEQLEVEYTAEPLALPINASAVLGIIEHMQADTCVFRFARAKDRQQSIIVNPLVGSEIDCSRTFLTMPMER